MRTGLPGEKAEIKEYENITLPDTIYGTHSPVTTSQEGRMIRHSNLEGNVQRSGAARIRGVSHFRCSDGHVLVIPYSDVGWTPLLTEAGAIIAEAGGFLSHSSIIAREYEIPAGRLCAGRLPARMISSPSMAIRVK